MKVVTVTLNPALDMTANVSQIYLGKVNQIQNASLNPGGKGINVAKVLAELGAKVTATGFLGSDNQQPFNRLFESTGIDDAFVRVAESTRVNVKLVERNEAVTDFNFPGMPVSKNEAHILEDKIFELANTHDLFVFAGSLPQGFSLDRLTEWIANLGSQGKKVVFDSSNRALKAGLEGIPWLVKPNDEELSQWAEEPLNTKRALLVAGNTLADTGIENIVISRGADGVLWLKDGEWLQSQPPEMQVVSTVGAGDSLVAAMCWAHFHQWSREKTLSFATALSALAVTQVNVGVENINDVVALQNQIQVSTVKVN